MSSMSDTEARTASAVRAEIEHYTMKWRGMDVLIVYKRDWAVLPDCSYSHLEVMTDAPRCPLPMSETGYKSHFTPAGTIEALGGPVAYVTRWLDHAAKSAAWKAIERDQRQGSLF